MSNTRNDSVSTPATSGDKAKVSLNLGQAFIESTVTVENGGHTVDVAGYLDEKGNPAVFIAGNVDHFLVSMSPAEAVAIAKQLVRMSKAASLMEPVGGEQP